MLYICSCLKRFSSRTEIDCSMIRWRCHNCFGLKSFVHDLFVFWICIRFVLCSTEKVNMFLTSCSSSNPTAALLRMKKKTNVERKLTGLSFNHFHIAHTSSANEQRYTIFVSLVRFLFFFSHLSTNAKWNDSEESPSIRNRNKENKKCETSISTTHEKINVGEIMRKFSILFCIVSLLLISAHHSSFSYYYWCVFS